MERRATNESTKRLTPSTSHDGGKKKPGTIDLPQWCSREGAKVHDVAETGVLKKYGNEAIQR
jgi:hypothetical protein